MKYTLFILFFLALNCSSESAGNLELEVFAPDLTKFSPCDGDPTGNWQAVASYTDGGPNFITDSNNCADSRLSASTGIAGSLQFKDGKSTFDYSFRLRYVGLVSETCLGDRFPGKTCNTLRFTAEDETGGCSFVEGSETCQCVRTVLRKIKQTGDYSVKSEENLPFDYCVTGDSLDTRWTTQRFDGEPIQIVTRWVR